MKTIVLIRHGAYSRRSRRLTQKGYSQIISIADALESIVPSPVTILAPPLGPAMDAARELGIRLKTTPKKDQALERHLDPAAVVDLIRAQAGQCETLVLIGRMELVQDFPGWLANLLFQRGSFDGRKNLHANCALVIDCKTATARVVSGDFH